MLKDKVKVGVIGAGAIGPFHIRAFQAQEDVEVLALCDIKEDRAQRVAKEYNIPKIFSDYRQLLDLKELDAVSICLPNYLHTPVSLAAFEAGLHVLCEKPMSINATEGQKIVEGSKKSGKKLMMAFCMRFGGDSQVLKQFMEAGELGEIYYVKASWLRRFGIPGMGSWFTRKAEAGGGPLIDLGVHILDLALWLMGHPKPISAYGVCYAKFGPRGKGKGDWGTPEPGGVFDVEDLAVGLVKLENGITISTEISWAGYCKDGIALSLWGTEGGADWGPLRIYKEMQGSFIDITPSVPKIDVYEAEARHFIECIREDKEPMATGEHGVAVMKILDALYESAERGEEVKIS